MPLVVEVSRNEELDDGPPGDCIPNSTSAAEYNVLQCYTNAKIHSPEMQCHSTAVSGMANLAFSNLMILNAMKSLYYLDKLHLAAIFDPNLPNLFKMCFFLNVHVSSFV